MTSYDGSASAPPVVSAQPERADEALLAAVLARGENASTKGSASGVLLITVALFMGLGGLQWGWAMVVYISVAIALHELGHVIAMRVFGYKNVRMLFVPLFGGLATGEPRELDATRNALVALAGPAFGVATAALAAGLAMLLESPAWLVEFAWVSLFLNAFNLLPLVPLDGGQVANDTLFSRFPVVELIFRLLAVVGLACLAYFLETWLLAVLPLFMLIATPVAYRRARIIRDLRRDPIWRTRVLDVETVGALREIVTKIFVGVSPDKLAPKLAEHVHGVWLEIHKRFPDPGRTVGLMAGYLGLFLLVVPGLALFLVYFLGPPKH